MNRTERANGAKPTISNQSLSDCVARQEEVLQAVQEGQAVQELSLFR